VKREAAQVASFNARNHTNPADCSTQGEAYSVAVVTKDSPIDQSRRNYVRGPLELDHLDADPIVQFQQWFEEACERIEVEPNAMTLATVDNSGAPSARMVLLKFFGRGGFVFFTNLESRKAVDIEGNRRVALLFWWPELERQIKINGVAERISSAEAAKYFVTRPRGSQLGAWVSQQSQALTSRKALEMKLDEMKRKFANRQIPLPSFWGGFRVVPSTIEFWQGQPDRLHDRFQYVREGEGWHILRLAP
jgi:pyridoxamine 5'-phosphate oxidase